VRQKYGPASDNPIFRGNEEITLSDRALGFLVAELARYDFARTEIDAKGIAYQELVGTNLRGDRGQYFTPRGAIHLMVEMLDPQEDERVLDPACGTGGFLRETLKHLLDRWKKKALRVTLTQIRISSLIKHGSQGLHRITSLVLISTHFSCVLPVWICSWWRTPRGMSSIWIRLPSRTDTSLVLSRREKRFPLRASTCS
jgi:hypothetical protein